MNSLFAEAVIHGQHRVLGYRLRPYSFAALFALEVVESPFVCGTGRTYTLADVLQAAKICSAPNPRCVDLRPSLRDRLTFALRKHDTAFVAAAAQCLTAYIDDYASLPEFYQDSESGGKPLSAPWVLTRIANLMRLTNCSREEAWNTPVGEGVWIECAIREVTGDSLRFVDPDEPEPDDGGVSEMSEADLYAMAVRDMGEDRARDWMDKRKAAQKAP